MQYVFSCWQPRWHKTMGYLQHRVSGSAVGILDGGYGIFLKSVLISYQFSHWLKYPKKGAISQPWALSN